jgi:iron complex outermembrane receptor protein
VSLTGARDANLWVIGAAFQRESYASQAAPRFDHAYSVPGVFAQNEFTIAPSLTLAASGRVDVHSEFGTFVSPRLSVLVRPDEAWAIRAGVGRGYVAPTPFTEETEATGLVPVAALGDLEPERADNFSADVTWRRAPLEITGTWFYSRVRDALALRDTGRGDRPLALINVDGPTRTRGTEFIARYHSEENALDVILTHMFLWSTEPGPDGGRREVPLNPRHSASFDLLKQIGPARIGVEVFYTGRQALDDNPFRDRGFPHVLYGGLIDWGIGRSRVYVNVENLGDVRQTRAHPLVKATRGSDGRWTLDAWAPLEGRTINGGVRLRF